jgi:general secretion pathway protein L
MPQRILGLDMGHWSVKAVLMESRFRAIQVVDCLEVPLSPETEGQLDLRDRQAVALEMLLSRLPARPDVVSTCVPADAATIHWVPLPFADPRKVQQVLPGELEDLIPFELSDCIFAYEISSSETGPEALVAIAKQSTVGNLLSFLDGFGLDPRHLSVDAIDLYTLYTHFLRDDDSRAERPPDVDEARIEAPVDATAKVSSVRLIVDIGHARSLILAATDDRVLYARSIANGGQGLTQAIRDAYGITLQEAEEGKHADAFIESSLHPAPSDAAQRMSQIVYQSIRPITQEIRRSLQYIRQKRQLSVTRIDLVGGGSKVRNLANHLAEHLQIPVAHGAAVEQAVARSVEGPRRAAFALPLALAIQASPEHDIKEIQLRNGPFRYSGGLEHLQTRMPAIAAASGILVFLWILVAVVQYQLIGRREKDVDQQVCSITKEVIGREECELAVALSLMREPSGELGVFELPKHSASFYAADLSERIPEGALEGTLFSELDITTNRARVSGTTDSFDSVDKIVAEYRKNPCYQDVRKSKIDKGSDGRGVEFQLSMQLDCPK